MNKKIMIPTIIILVIIALVLIGFGMKNQNKTNTNIDNKTSKIETINSTDDLVKLVEKIYEGNDELYPTLETNIVNLEDAENVKYVTGLENGENLEYLVSSEPMMSGQAYSLVVAKVKDGVNANEIAKQMSENMDMRKWICVSAEKLYVTTSNDIVFAVMADEEMAKPIYENFKKIAGKTGETYEKTEEF